MGQQGMAIFATWSLWRNRLARSAVNRKVGGSSPPRDGSFYEGLYGLTLDEKTAACHVNVRVRVTPLMSPAVLVSLVVSPAPDYERVTKIKPPRRGIEPRSPA